MTTWETALEEERKKSEEKEKTKKAEDSEKAKTTEEKKKLIVFEARDLLGAHLVEKYATEISRYPNLRSFFKNFGPYCLLFAANIRQGSPYNNVPNTIDGLTAQLTSGDSYLWQIAEEMYGSAIDQTNLKKTKNQQTKNIPFTEIFPETGLLERLIRENKKPLEHPYDLILMTSESTYRPLLTLATKRTLDEIDKITQGASGQSRNAFGGTPSLESILKIAKEYGITDLKGAIDQINTVIRGLPL